MIGSVSKWRHAAVVSAVGGCAVLAATGVIGSSQPERYDSWQSVVTPSGFTGVRVVDTFDQDFGTNERRGPERFFAHDSGIPVSIEVSSPTAPDTVTTDHMESETRVRVGEEDTFISGQHRYRFAYILGRARGEAGVLSLDVLSADGPEIDRFELVVSGFLLEDPRCFFGAEGSTQECEWVEQRAGFYRAVIEPLDADEGVTIEGVVADTMFPPETVAAPPLPEARTPRSRGPLTAGVAGMGALSGLGMYLLSRRRGRNEVFAGGSVEAAYGTLSPPGQAGGTPPVELVADADMDDLATIEFVPPPGLAPWEGRTLLYERVEDSTVEAWLSGLAGAEVIELEERDDELVIRSGPNRGELAEPDASWLTSLLQGSDTYRTGVYDPKFAEAWTEIELALGGRMLQSGWWKRLAPGSGMNDTRAGMWAGAIVYLVCLALWALGPDVVTVFGWLGSVPGALVFGAMLPAATAFVVYRVLAPARTATGSALALRTESFRRFLHASEAQHVDWAWSRGLVREYSGWAVALGEADAWSEALTASNVPAPSRASMAAPVAIARLGSALRTTHKAPASSRVSGGGGVGGGGGGGSRGSW